MAQSTLNKIIAGMNGLWMSSMEVIKDKVKTFINNHDDQEYDELMKYFDNSFPLVGLETEYMQLKYYKQHFNYIVSITFVKCLFY